MEQFGAISIIQNPWALAVLVAWTLPWKGVALWKAARLGQIWFIVLLAVNTLAFLEIFYIFVIAKKKSQSIMKTEAKAPIS